MHITVLIIEAEQPEGLSARKLILETSKHNVLTAYNGIEGIRLFRRFPAVDAVVVHVNVADIPFAEVVQQIRGIRADVPVIALSPVGPVQLQGVDYVLPSHQPQALLTLLAEKFGASTAN
jgi:DNA-binding response OmpR family regulator